jgi:Flp pilus assembly secretin CpaC
MLDALSRPPSHVRGARSRRYVWPLVLGAVITMSLAAAFPGVTSKQDQPSALVDVMTAGKHDKNQRTIPEHMDAWLTFSKDVTKVVSADDSIIKLPKEAPENRRQLRLIPSVNQKPDGNEKQPTYGSTVITFQFADGTTEQIVFSVRRDLTVLSNGLKTIHPAIEVDVTHDRDVIVLTGSVPDATYSARAVQAASDYVNATRVDQKPASGKVINLIRIQSPATSLEQRMQAELGLLGGQNVSVRRIQQGTMPDDAQDVFVVTGVMPDIGRLRDATMLAQAAVGDKDGKRVVSQLQTSDRLSSIEQIIEMAIHTQVKAPKVKVSRVAQADASGELDILVLTGSVPNQTALVQALTLASKVFQQQEIVRRRRSGEIQRITETFAGGLTKTTETPLSVIATGDDIKVAADESGALRQNAGRNGLESSDTGLRDVFGSGIQNTSAAFGSGFSDLLDNQLEANIGRAKAIELAEGRIVSFLTVEDLPQVRIDIKLYDVNRTDLLAWNSQLQQATVADFDTNGINPNAITGGTNANGDPILGSSNTDIANIVSFLETGFGNQIQVGGGHFAIDAAFNLLERQGIAKSLSSPSLTVLSGELAAFGDGGSVSVRTSVSTEVGGIGNSGVFSSVEQLTFGVQLAIRPLVDEDGFITLDVVPSVSNPDFALTQLVRASTGTPQETIAFSQRSMRTSARLRDGEVLLIGGLTDSSRTDNKDSTPGLSDIPILGWLFHDKNFEDKNRELVITVNPTIVRDALPEARLWAYPTSRELLPPLPRKQEGEKK